MLIALFLSVFLASHPAHVTFTSIDYLPGADSFQVFVRMYYDDFLLDYRVCREEEQDSNFIEFKESPEEMALQYLERKLNIFVNNKLLKGELVDLRIAENEISMNLRYSADRKPKVITVKNQIMTQLYSDQANMTIIRVNEFEEGIRLTSEKTEQTFKLN